MYPRQHSKDDLLASMRPKGTANFQPHPKTGRVEDHPGMFDPNANSRDYEHAAHAGESIARSSSVSKHSVSANVLTHGGMHHVTGTNDGAPKLEMLASIPDGSSPLYVDPTAPLPEKQRPVRVHEGMTEKQKQTFAAHQEAGAGSEAVLSEALRGKPHWSA